MVTKEQHELTVKKILINDLHYTIKAMQADWDADTAHFRNREAQLMHEINERTDASEEHLDTIDRLKDQVKALINECYGRGPVNVENDKLIAEIANLEKEKSFILKEWEQDNKDNGETIDYLKARIQQLNKGSSDNAKAFNKRFSELNGEVEKLTKIRETLRRNLEKSVEETRKQIELRDEWYQEFLNAADELAPMRERYETQVIANAALTDINDKLNKNLDTAIHANHEAAKEIKKLKEDAAIGDSCFNIMECIAERRLKKIVSQQSIIAKLTNEVNELKAQKLAE